MRKPNSKCSVCTKAIYRRPSENHISEKFCTDCTKVRLKEAGLRATNNRVKENLLNWKSGELPGWSGKTRQLRKFIRRYILEKYNFSCVKCSWNKRHPVDGKPLVEVNHIDGDAENCKEENLEVLCPNCHSETINFRARNKFGKRNRRPT